MQQRFGDFKNSYHDQCIILLLWYFTDENFLSSLRPKKWKGHPISPIKTDQ